MSIVQPQNFKSTVMIGPQRLTITIPTKQINVIFFAMLLNLVMWTIIGGVDIYFIVKYLQTGSLPFKFKDPIVLYVFIVVCIIDGILFSGYIVLCDLKGEEIVVVENNLLTIKRNLLRKTRQFQLNAVTNMRVIPPPPPTSRKNAAEGFRTLGIGGGIIAFDYGNKTYRFGIAIDEPEANTIISEIQKFNERFK